MAQENAKKFLEKVWADETLRDRIGGKTPEEIVEIAAEQGFDVTAEDLKKAAESFRKESAETNDAAAEKIRELNVDKMDKVAGGYFFHPQVCSADFDDGNTCWFNDYCSQMWNADHDLGRTGRYLRRTEAASDDRTRCRTEAKDPHF